MDDFIIKKLLESGAKDDILLGIHYLKGKTIEEIARIFGKLNNHSIIIDVKVRLISTDSLIFQSSNWFMHWNYAIFIYKQYPDFNRRVDNRIYEEL